jgi:hypothetical protein
VNERIMDLEDVEDIQQSLIDEPTAERLARTFKA